VVLFSISARSGLRSTVTLVAQHDDFDRQVVLNSARDADELDHAYECHTGAYTYTFTTPRFVLATTGDPILLALSLIPISSYSCSAIGITPNTGELTNVGIGCPSTLTNTHAAPAVVSAGKVLKARLSGKLAPKRVTEILLGSSLLSIAGHGALPNASGGTTPITWQFSRANNTKPWTGKPTVSLPVLGGRGIFAHGMTVYRAKNENVSGRSSRQVTLNGKQQTETVNWSVVSVGS
jgi:hypothetical protein